MSILYGTVNQISDEGLDIELSDGAKGHVPISEVFMTNTTPVVLPYLVYDHPISIMVGQSIPILPLPEKKGQYSRKAAALTAIHSVFVGSVVPATITEISAQEILVVTDTGFEVCLPRPATEKALQERFTQPRLNPESTESSDIAHAKTAREREEQWLYIRDRIRVRIDNRQAEPFINGQLVIRGAAVQAEVAGANMAVSEPPTAPPSSYEDVLVVDDDLDMVGAVDQYFRDGGYRTHFAISLDDVTKWQAGFLQECSGPDAKHGVVLALVKQGSSDFDWEAVCARLVRELPTVDTIITHSSHNPLTSKQVASVASKASDFHILGVWNETDGLDALSAIMTRQWSLSRTFEVQHDQPAPPAGDAARPARTGEDIGRYRSLAEDCRLVLEALLEAAGEKAAPCAAILFQIHKKGHGVSIVACCGDDGIIRGYKTYLPQLHKSPVRDLAIFRRAADTDNANESVGRYRYFLHAMGGPDKDLSVLGVRLSAVPGNPFAYTAFLFSGRASAFRDNPRVSEKALLRFRRAFELALGMSALDQRAQHVRQLAERAADFQYMAHEAVGYLRIPMEFVPQLRQQACVEDPEWQTLCSGVTRAYSVLNQFLPGQEIEYEDFSPNVSVKELFLLCQLIEDEPSIRLAFRSDVADDVRVQGRQLAFECVLRNVLLNAIQQIQEYSGGTGEVEVHISVQRDKAQGAQLVVAVTDDGPGIHGKHWEAIYKGGVSTRKKGMGLGLPVSRRLMSDAKGSLDLVESFVYSGTTFRISMPVSDMPQTTQQRSEV